MHVEQLDAALAAGEEAYLLLQADGDEAALVEWETLLAKIMRFSGRPAGAELLSRRAVQRAEALGDDTALAKALSYLSGNLLVTGAYAECIAAARRALELAEPVGLEPEAVYALNSYGTALSLALDGGDFDAGVAALQESLDRAKRAGLGQRAGLAVHLARAGNNLGTTLVAGGWPAEALVAYDEGIGPPSSTRSSVS